MYEGRFAWVLVSEVLYRSEKIFKAEALQFNIAVYVANINKLLLAQVPSKGIEHTVTAAAATESFQLLFSH